MRIVLPLYLREALHRQPSGATGNGTQDAAHALADIPGLLPSASVIRTTTTCFSRL